MRTDRYLIRAVKYFVLLIVLIVALYALSYYFESTPMSVEDYIAMLRADERSKWLLPVLILLALAYPAFGYMTRSLPISLEQNRAGVDAAMTACEFELRASARVCCCIVPRRRRVVRVCCGRTNWRCGRRAIER